MAVDHMVHNNDIKNGKKVQRFQRIYEDHHEAVRKTTGTEAAQLTAGVDAKNVKKMGGSHGNVGGGSAGGTKKGGWAKLKGGNFIFSFFNF